MLACEIWAGKSRESVTKFRDDTQKAFGQIVKDDQKQGGGASARHVNCGAFGTMGARGAIDRQRDVALNRLAAVARTAAEGAISRAFLPSIVTPSRRRIRWASTASTVIDVL